MISQWLTHEEADFYKQNTGSDPYAIWVTKLVNLKIVKIPARLLVYENNKAQIIYLDGKRDTILIEQMSPRH